MSILKANQATVRRTLIKGRKVPDSLSTLDNVCNAGAQCQEVQNSPIAQQALGTLQQTVIKARGTLAKKQSLAQALMAETKVLELDFEEVKVALGTYQVAVDAIAKGDASVINKAGLLSRLQRSLSEPLGKVSEVYSKLGKNPKEALINWPAAPGATGYALEVNYTPQDPSAPWTALTSGSGRRRVVKGPLPGCQFLVRIASLGSDGTQSDWSDAILATAL